MSSFSKRMLGVVQSAIVIGTSVILTAAVIGGGAYAVGRGFDYLRGAKPGSSLKGAAKFLNKNSDFAAACTVAAVATQIDCAANK